jgi:hypothetical protein
MEFEDVTDQPRPHEDVVKALLCIEEEMVLNPMAMSQRSGPLLLHYSVIRDCLRELLLLRKKGEQ